MKHNRLSMKLMSTAITLCCVTMLGCNNNDTTDDTSVTTMDTTSHMMADSNHMGMDTNNMAMDTSRMMADTNKADHTAVKNKAVDTGAAKPNPAKKGMKGKVSISDKPVKSSGNMEADNAGVYSNVEVIPTFPGGYKGL